jgi:hypothetical protein
MIGVASVLALLAFSYGASAQNRKTKPKPLATPPVLTGAEIISQGGDLTDPQPIEQPAERTQARSTGTNTAKIRDLNDRVNKLEAERKTGYDEKQRMLLLNLDILTRAEQRAEALRKQSFDMAEKENTIRTRLDQIEHDIRPDVIERTTVQIVGSLRPEEIRENRRKTLDGERRNLQSLVTQLQNSRASLDAALARAEQLVDRLREKLERDIDKALLKDDEDQ